MHPFNRRAQQSRLSTVCVAVATPNEDGRNPLRLFLGSSVFGNPYRLFLRDPFRLLFFADSLNGFSSSELALKLCFVDDILILADRKIGTRKD